MNCAASVFKMTCVLLYCGLVHSSCRALGGCGGTLVERQECLHLIAFRPR